jgi:hypothetical protein
MPLKSKLLKIGRYFASPGLYRYGLRSTLRLSNLKDDPIIVCGAPRSGTTLLISILDSHNEILAIPFETWLLVNKRSNRWFKRDSLNKKFILLQLKAFLISLNITKDHKRWCEKTPTNVFYLDFIFSLFDRKVKVINIIRDGRDVVMSHHSRLGKFMTPQKWVHYVEQGLKYKDDPNVLTIRYEDLITKYDETMALVARFLHIENTFRQEFYLNTNVSDNASVISGHGNKGIYKAKPISRQSLAKWKNNEQIEKQFNDFPPAQDLLRHLGYEI